MVSGISIVLIEIEEDSAQATITSVRMTYNEASFKLLLF